MDWKLADDLGFAKKLILAFAEFLAIASLICISMANAPPSPAQSLPVTGGRPAFEVASIKLNKSGNRGSSTRPFSGGRLNVENQSVRSLIRAAYGVQDYQISGGPGWINSDRYDIRAKAAGNPPLLEVVGPMLRSLLEDRFKLRFHHETKELPIYALVVAKNGLKLRPSGKQSCAPFDPNNISPSSAVGRNGSRTCGSLAIRKNVLMGTQIGMEDFTRSLSYILGRTVIDRTGFTEKFDVQVEFTANEAAASKALNSATDAAESEAPVEIAGPSIFTALQEQLGLKLEPTKGPIDVLVIDHAERPSEN